MKLFDLHCDTVIPVRERQETLADNTCHVSLTKALSVFEDYTQVMAFFSQHHLDGEENYRRFHEILAYVSPMMRDVPGFHPILAVEGGKLLCSDLSRLDVLHACGVRILTLVWKDVCCVGGAYNTDEGLTAFGRQVVERCFDLGIVPDLSHASDALASDTLDIAEKRGCAVIASHSCSRALCPVPRNLSDEMARRIAAVGGIVGVNLVLEHLGGRQIEDVCRHVYHFADVIGEDRVCLGADLDGTDELPEGIAHVGDLPKLYRALCDNSHSEAFAEKVFYSNAQSFAAAHFF